MSAAKIIFDALVAGGEAEVLRLIAIDEPERLHLDFKSRPLEKDLQSLLGKALSGFANADGGVLLFGVAEETGFALRSRLTRTALSKSSIHSFLALLRFRFRE